MLGLAAVPRLDELDLPFLREKMRYNSAHTPPTTKVASPGTPRNADPIPVTMKTNKQIRNFFILP